MFIQWIAKIFVAFNSNTKPGQISLGVAFGLLLALIPTILPATPPVNLLWVLLLLITFFLKINQAIELTFLALFRIITPFTAPAVSALGEFILKQPALQDFFTALYNLPGVSFSMFHHTRATGGLVIGIALFVPTVILFNFLVRLYRDKIREKIANSKIFKAFMKLPIIKQVGGALSKAVSFYQGIK
ncbi:MAG: TIGR03546 family protein [Spirochaetales bacterium]|nr:TIGR03546 family protein [Spirochaetales bacterium]